MNFTQILLISLGSGALVATLFLVLQRLLATRTDKGQHDYQAQRRLHQQQSPQACAHCGGTEVLARHLEQSLIYLCSGCSKEVARFARRR